MKYAYGEQQEDRSTKLVVVLIHLNEANPQITASPPLVSRFTILIPRQTQTRTKKKKKKEKAKQERKDENKQSNK